MKQKAEIEKQIHQQKFISDCQIDTDLELLFPETYINNISERIRLYRELDNLETEAKLIDFENQLIDRFGKIPEQSMELINVVRLRWLAISLGFEKIILKNKTLVLFFISNKDSAFYKSPVFPKILQYVQQNPRSISLKESNNRLSMTINKIDSIKKAIDTVQKIQN